MFDPKLMAAQVIEVVKAYVADALKNLDQRFVDVEKKIESIPAPESVDVEAIAKAAAELVVIPDPIPGKDGDDGVSMEPEEILSHVDQAVAKAVAALPPAEPGKDAIPIDQAEVVKEVLAQIRQPEDGKSITLDDIQPLFDKAFGSWALDFERRAQDLFQKAVDKMPKPKDGENGFGFDDLSVDYDGERGITIKFSQGEKVKEFPFTLPLVLDRGVFKEGFVDYVKGDGVTWGGSFFVAQKDNPEGKPGESDGWRLIVKRGRDGKNFEPREVSNKPVKL